MLCSHHILESRRCSLTYTTFTCSRLSECSLYLQFGVKTLPKLDLSNKMKVRLPSHVWLSTWVNTRFLQARWVGCHSLFEIFPTQSWAQISRRQAHQGEKPKNTGVSGYPYTFRESSQWTGVSHLRVDSFTNLELSRYAVYTSIKAQNTIP